MLYQCLSALDRANQAKALLDREGLTITTESTGAVHLHPASKLEREFRAQALKGFASLGLQSITTASYPFVDIEDDDDDAVEASSP